PKPFGDVRWNRNRRPAHLVGQPESLVGGHLLCLPVHQLCHRLTLLPRHALAETLHLCHGCSFLLLNTSSLRRFVAPSLSVTNRLAIRTSTSRAPVHRP